MYTLYAYPFSQHSRRVVSLLEQLDIEYETELVDMMKGEYLTDAYLAINPNHQVPTLVDGDIRIHESNAILRYLCKKHARFDWYPQDPVSLALTEQWLDWNQCQLSKQVVDLVLNTVFLGDNGDTAAAEKARQILPELFEVLADHLAKHPYASGLQPSIADLSLASNVFQLGLAGFVPEQQTIRNWYDKVSSLKGFAASLPQQ